MKKRHRDIVISGIRYSYSVKSDHDEGYTVKIWKEGNLVIEKYFYGAEKITPSVIRNMVNN